MQNRRIWIVAFLFLLAMINYIDRVALSFAIGPMAKEFGFGTVAKGYLFSSFLWTYTLSLIPLGMLVDRYGSKRIAALGIAVWSAATALTGAASSFWTTLVARLFMGSGEASSNPACAKVIREWIPAGERGVVNAAFNSGSYAGPAVCALIAGAVIDLWGWRVLFLGAGAMGFLWLALWLFFFDKPETVTWVSEREREKILAERNHGPQKAVEHKAPNGLRRLLKTKTMWGLALTQGCNVYPQYLFLTWLPSYLQTSRHLTLLKTGGYTAVPYLFAVVLCIGMGKISDRLVANGGPSSGRRRNMIACSMIIASVVLAAPYVGSVWLLLLLITISLSGVATTTSLNFALTNDLIYNPSDIGKAMGFVVVGGNVFGLLAPIVTGYVIALSGSYDTAFVIAGVLLLAGAVATLTLTRSPIRQESLAYERSVA